MTETGQGLTTLDQPLEQDALLQQAETATGLNNWGTNPHFRIGLGELIRATEAMNPPPQLRANVHNRIMQILTMKLHIVDDEVRHPDILQGRVDKPLIVIGLPRTGTTIVYDLLSLDPSCRAPAEWETFMPWPAPEIATYDSDPRIDAINGMYAQMLEKSPELADIQRLDATRPGECNHIMTHHFASTNFAAELAVPAYGDWFHHNKVPGQYASHKRILQQLQWKGPRGNWLLKSPVHLFDLEGLLATYPDAQLVWTHRDPVLTISSISSMVHALIKAQGVAITKEQVGHAQWDTWKLGLAAGTRTRANTPKVENAIVDMAHKDVVLDPVAAVRGIYEHFDREFSPEHAARIDDFIHHNPAASRIGKHRHSPEEYGLDPDEIRADLAGYYQRFGDYCARVGAGSGGK
jgi:Sulfotransferase family